MDPNAKCSSCVYWKAFDLRERVGQCRCDPPRVSVLRIQQSSPKEATAVWPVTKRDEWCGHWVLAADRTN